MVEEVYDGVEEEEEKLYYVYIILKEHSCAAITMEKK
jgi:hypothetical protein